jgi:hypothetical protein
VPTHDWHDKSGDSGSQGFSRKWTVKSVITMALGRRPIPADEFANTTAFLKSEKPLLFASYGLKIVGFTHQFTSATGMVRVEGCFFIT